MMTHASEANSGTPKPDYVTTLEAIYGAPSQEGFGSAVFYEAGPITTDLEEAALTKYRFFVGDLWERYGEAAWMSPWQEVYTRPRHAAHDIVDHDIVDHDIVAELRGIDDREARLSASLIVDEMDNAEDARAALAAAFDDPAVTNLAVYKIGDGGAMGGILVTARRAATGEMLFLIFLLD